MSRYYGLVVIDEAHHVYADVEARARVETYVTPGRDTRRLLLSDASQATARSRFGLPNLREVRLTEVVRCSERIVAGAMAFQLGGETKLLTKCTHTVAGPPLKSFLFEEPGSTTSLHATYAEHVVRAIEHVKTTFPKLRLHNRVAIVVPDDAFRLALRPALQEALRLRFSEWRVRLLDASRCSSLLDSFVEEGAAEAGQFQGFASDDDMVRATEGICIRAHSHNYAHRFTNTFTY
jgi:hypothetical protein